MTRSPYRRRLALAALRAAAVSPSLFCAPPASPTASPVTAETVVIDDQAVVIDTNWGYSS